jgi:hypothetical protein
MKIFCFLSFISSQLLAQNGFDALDLNLIIWEPNKKLEWKDFSGTMDPNLFGNALTTYSIEIVPENVMVDGEDNIQGYENLTVVTKFYKDKSWTVSRTDNLLKHEQLHFDIAELYARKIRKKFSDLINLEEKKFDAYANAYEVLWQECRQYQKKYDLETKNGILVDQNSIWTNKIRQEIKMLDNYRWNK